MNANGILNVSAKELSTGKVKNITIKNDKGRLSQSDIDRMLAEAERYKEEDERQREKITARNTLESYIFSVKQAIDECGDKLSDTDKTLVRDKCDENIKWLDGNSLADKEEFEHRLNDLTKVCSPIMSKLHGGSSQQSSASCGQQAGGFGTQSGPTVEEVD